MAVAKMGGTGRTLRERKSFQPPVFYSALRGLHCLRAGGGELGSFPTGSSASNRRPMFHNKMSVAMAGRQKVFPPGRKPPFPPVARKCFPGRDGLSRKPPSRRIWSGFPPGRMPPFIRNPGRIPPTLLKITLGWLPPETDAPRGRCPPLFRNPGRIPPTFLKISLGRMPPLFGILLERCEVWEARIHAVRGYGSNHFWGIGSKLSGKNLRYLPCFGL